jgi:hypothetical protein
VRARAHAPRVVGFTRGDPTASRSRAVSPRRGLITMADAASLARRRRNRPGSRERYRTLSPCSLRLQNTPRSPGGEGTDNGDKRTHEKTGKPKVGTRPEPSEPEGVNEKNKGQWGRRKARPGTDFSPLPRAAALL